VQPHQRQILILAACVLIPSLLTAILCWPLLARGRRFAPYLVLLSWLAGSAAAAFLLLQNPGLHPTTPAVLSTALIFLLFSRRA
jgi:hypothetical protein